jgi:hypothetical protein
VGTSKGYGGVSTQPWKDAADALNDFLNAPDNAPDSADSPPAPDADPDTRPDDRAAARDRLIGALGRALARGSRAGGGGGVVGTLGVGLGGAAELVLHARAASVRGQPPVGRRSLAHTPFEETTQPQPARSA